MNLKIIFKWCAIFLSAFGLLIFLFLFFLTTSPGEALLRKFAEKQFSEFLGQKVTLTRLETNLLSRLQLSDLKIHPAREDWPPLFELREARLQYKIFHLLKKTVTIESLTLDGLNVHLIQDSSGLVNVPDIFRETQPSPPPDSTPPDFQINFGSLYVGEANFFYNQKSIPLTASLVNLNLELNPIHPASYLFHATIDSGGAHYRNTFLPLKGFSLQGSLAQQGVKLDSISIQLPGVSLTGALSADFTVPETALKGEVHVTAETALLSTTMAEFLPPEIHPLSGRLSGHIQVDGSLENPRVESTIRFAHLQAGGLHFRNGNLHAAMEKDFIQLQRFQWEMFEGKVSGEGYVRLDSLLTQQMSFSVKRLDFGEIWQAIYQETSPYRGVLEGEVTSRGPVSHPDSLKILASLAFRNVLFQNKPMDDFLTDISYRKGRAKLEFRQGESHIRSDLYLQEDRVSGDFRVHVSRLQPLAALANIPDLSGALDLSGTIGGTLHQPQIQTKFSGKNLRYQNFPVDNISGELHWSPDKIHLSETRFEGALAHIDSQQAPFGIKELSGGFSYRGVVQGESGNLNGHLTIDLLEPGYFPIAFRRGRIQLDLDGERIEFTTFRFEHDSLTLELGGVWDLSAAEAQLNLLVLPPDSHRSESEPQTEFGRIEAQLGLADSANFKLNIRGNALRIQPLVALLPESPGIGGILDFRADFQGNAAHPRGTLEFGIDSARFDRVQTDSLRGVIRLREETLYLDSLNLYLKGYHSWARGRVKLQRDEAGLLTLSNSSFTEGEASGEELNLRLLQPFIDPEMQIAGVSIFHVHWRGKIKMPEITGDFRLREGYFRLDPQSPPLSALEMDIILEDSLLEIHSIQGKVNQTSFRIEGHIANRNFENFRPRLQMEIAGMPVVELDGDISLDTMQVNLWVNNLELSFLRAFLTDFSQLAGVANASLNLQGPRANPLIEGRVHITHLKIQPTFLNEPFENGIIKINFTRNRVFLDSLYFNKNGGSIFLSGYLTHQMGKLSDLSFRATVSNLRVNQPKQYQIAVKKADLQYKKQDQYYNLEGDIILDETRLIYNFPPKFILSSLQTVERPIRKPSDLLQNTRLNIRLRESENIWVDNNLARMRLHAEMSVIGSLSNPNITGRLSVEEGYVLYLDRRFRVQKGVMDFVDPNRLNPIVDLQATTTLKNYQTLEGTTYDITLIVNGPMDEAVVELTSDPPLDKSDILSLLTVGATRGQLTGQSKESGGSVSDLLRQRLEALSSSRISGYISRWVGNLLGLDEMNIEGNLFRVHESAGPQIIAAKQISDRIKLTYTTTVGHLNEQSIRLDYRLSQRFSLEGQTDQKGRSGIDLKYRVKFK
ncbi:MAG: hypothetical protein Kow0042_19160 [Calditrichia bacterium]